MVFCTVVIISTTKCVFPVIVRVNLATFEHFVFYVPLSSSGKQLLCVSGRFIVECIDLFSCFCAKSSKALRNHPLCFGIN